MRIRLPKSVLTNMKAEKGKTFFEIYFDKNSNELILKVKQQVKENNNEE